MNIMVMYMYLLWIKISDIKKRTAMMQCRSLLRNLSHIFESHFWYMPARNNFSSAAIENTHTDMHAEI